MAYWKEDNQRYALHYTENEVKDLVAGKVEDRKQLRCSFCNKTQDQVLNFAYPEYIYVMNA